MRARVALLAMMAAATTAAAAAGGGADVLIYCGTTREAPWSGGDRGGALGGSETNAAELALVLRERGFSVVVSGRVVAGESEGVVYIPEDQLRIVDGSDVPLFSHVIISRVVQQYVLKHPLVARRGVYLWVQDLYPNMSPGPTDVESVEQRLRSIAHRLTRVLALSPFHAAEMQAAFPELHKEYPQLWDWIPNAIDAQRWAKAEKAFRSDGESKLRHRFIYTSTPERGLLRLLRLFPRIRQALPGATLLVATYNQDGLNPEMRHLMEMHADHVTFAGSLSKDDLYREILRAEVRQLHACDACFGKRDALQR